MNTINRVFTATIILVAFACTSLAQVPPTRAESAIASTKLEDIFMRDACVLPDEETPIRKD